MNSDIFDFEITRDRIAQYPLENREDARLMVVNRKDEDIFHLKFNDIISFFSPGEVIVLNNTKVIPARLIGKKETGGKIEVLLLRKQNDGIWEVLIRGKIKPETKIVFEQIQAVVLGKNEYGSYTVKFNTDDDEKIFSIGKLPLPPYIKRDPEQKDYQYYQTVYAEKIGSVAAPTAGLHFTENILNQLKNKGIIVEFLTLHIGWASFRILDKSSKNYVPPEYFEISEKTSDVINRALIEKRKICAVGTSTVRALESAFKDNRILPTRGFTELFIRPGYVFHCVDKMVTNFHLPGSTHLYMVCAFGGNKLIERAYRTAIEKGYRFYSYGDAMLII